MTLAEKQMYDLMIEIRILNLDLESFEEEYSETNDSEYQEYLFLCKIRPIKHKIEDLFDRLYSNPAYVDEDACWSQYYKLYE